MSEEDWEEVSSESDWEEVSSPDTAPRQYAYPSWLTEMGPLGSVPARGLASIMKGGAGLERLLGEAVASSGFGDNAILRDALVNKKSAEDLVSQAQEDNEIIPGSWNDIAGSVGGEVLAMLPTLGGGLALNAGRRAATVAPSLLNKLYMAAAPAVLPSGSKYSQLRDEGVSPSDASVSAAESFALNTLLNRFDVGAMLKPRPFASRVLPMTVIGAGTNTAGALGDAYIDKQAGAPQTREELFTNLLASTAVGAGTGAAMSALPTGMRARNDDASGVSADSILEMLQAEGSPPLDVPPISPLDTPLISPLDALSNPPPFAGGNVLTLDSEIPAIRGRPRPAGDSLADITMEPQPKIRVVEASRARSPEDIANALWINEVSAPLSAENARLRNLEDVFLPEGTELSSFRESLPEGALAPSQLQKNQIASAVTKEGVASRRLSPDEQDIVSHILETTPQKAAQAKQQEGQVIFDETMIKRGEARETRTSSPLADSELVIKLGPEAESFPKGIVTELKARPSPVSQPLVIEEGYRPRTESDQQSPPSMPSAPPSMPDSLPLMPRARPLIPESKVSGIRTEEVLVKNLQLSQDVPQFKGGADARGVVAPLKGSFDKRGLAPIIVWRRLDGRQEVVSGRHRLDLAQRTGEATLPVQIFNEADGFTAKDAATIDAELNIRDEHGSIQDYANYFRSSGIDQAAAESRGFLRHSKGVLGYNIGTKATPELYSLYQNGRIPDRMAAAIASSAPNNDALQQVGIRAALNKQPIDIVTNQILALESDYGSLPPAEQQSLFGSDDRAIRLAEAQSQVATQMQRDVAEQIASVQGAAKRPEIARKLGVDVADPDGVTKRILSLKVQQERLDRWFMDPELKSLIKETAVKDLETGNASRKKTAQSIANKKKRAVSSSEAGFISVDLIEDVASFFRRKKDEGLLPHYQNISGSNQRYERVWPRFVEWMTTTKRKAPQSAGYIDAYNKVPQDLNAIVYDAKLTLNPFLELTDQDRQPVNRYLAAARIRAAQSPGYQVTTESALKVGLTPKQAEAAVAVNNWSGEMLNLLEEHAVDGARHDDWKKSLRLGPDSKEVPLNQTLESKTSEIRSKFSEMRDSNYVPFNRYGEHFVNVFNPDGSLAARHQFESKTDAGFVKTVRHFTQLSKEQGAPPPKYGRQNPSKLLQYEGVASDILELLNDEGSQPEIRGFYKHLKPAALVPGFNPDILRSVSEYTTGAAKLISMQRAQRAGERELAGSLGGIDNENLVRKLTAWSAGFNDKTHVAFKVLNEAFNTAYISGNLRTPTADMLGRVQLQYPLLSKYLTGLQPEAVWAKGISKEIRWWFTSDESFAKQNLELSDGIKAAQRKGIIPTRIYKTFLRNATGQDKGGWGIYNRIQDLNFGLKEISERSTDLGGFILGWEAYPSYAQGKGKGKAIPSRQQFSEAFVQESRAVPTQQELPPAFRNKTLRLMSKFRLYQAKIAKSMSEAGLGQWTRYLASVGFTTGIMGLPFVKDVISASRAAGTEPEDKLREMGAGPATLYGPMSKMAGLDLSGSAGFGEIFPGSGQSAVQKGLFGILQAPFEAATRASNHWERGQPLKAAASLPFMPNLISNVLTGSDWANRGVVTLGGRAVIPRDEVDFVDIVKKMVGFQPLKVKEAMVGENRRKQAEYRSKDNEFINQRIGEAEGLGDIGKGQELRAYARERGLRVNQSSVSEYRRKIQGMGRKIPKAIRSEIRKVEDLYD